MKQEENKWTEGYRNRLEGYSELAPEEIWVSLEKELSKPVMTIGRPYRKLAVAAAVLLALVSSVSLLFLYTPQAEYIKEARINIPASESLRIPEPISPHKEVALTAKVYRNKSNYQGKEEKDYLSGDEILADTKVIVSELENVPDNKEIDVNSKKSIVRKTLPIYADVDGSRPLTKRNKGIEKKWAVGVSAGNSPLVANDGRAGLSNLPVGLKNEADPYPIADLMIQDAKIGDESPLSQDAYRDILINNINKETYTDIKHRMPFTVGAFFRFGLSRNFSIETGLNYTLLSSELKSGAETDYYLKEQKLHYLGIPIRGNWMFLSKKYFSLYLSAGGMVEMCVAGTLKSEYITSSSAKVQEDEKQRVKPLQWSVTSAIGAQYNATRHIGIFVEPGIAYYFNDGSPIQTIRKEKPFNFNLQMGFRFTY